MELIVAVIIIIGTIIIFSNATNKIQTIPVNVVFGKENLESDSSCFRTDCITKDKLVEMRKRENSKDSKLAVLSKSFKVGVRRFSYIIFIILVSLFFAGCVNSNAFDGPKIVTTKIETLEWNAVAKIQEWKLCDESGWEVPEGAIVYKEGKEIVSYQTVGYETKCRVEEYEELVGYIPYIWRPRYETRTRKVYYQEPIVEPVYCIKYYYTIERWVDSKNLVIASGHDKEYSYPEYVCGENERVHSVEYSYLVGLECNQDGFFYCVDRETWESLRIGQEISGEKYEGGNADVDWDKYQKSK